MSFHPERLAHEHSSRSRLGFTLLETLCVLVLLGVLATLSFSILSRGVLAYTEARHWSRDNTQIALALCRLHKELIRLERVEAVSEQKLVFTTGTSLRNPAKRSDNADTTADTTSVFRVTLEYVPAERVILLQGAPLLEGVHAFTLHTRSGAQPWTPDRPARELSFVELELTLGYGAGDTTPHYGTFRFAVCPRNNGNSAGSPVLSSGGTS